MVAGGSRAGGRMPTISDDRKHYAAQMIEAGEDYEEIQRVTGPDGLWPLAEKEISKGSLTNIKQRVELHDDPCYRKKRVEDGSLTLEQEMVIEDCFAEKATTSTSEVRQRLLADGHMYLGRSLTHFPTSTINRAGTNQGHTFKKAYKVAPDVNPYEVARYHVAAAGYNTVRSPPHRLCSRLLRAAL